MDELNREKVKSLKLLENWHLIGVAITLPWTIISNNIAIILFVIYQIWLFAKNRKPFIFDPILFAFWSLFFLSGIGLIYTSDFPNGLKEFEKHLVFFLFPLLIPSLNKKEIERLFMLFSISLSIRFLLFVLTKDQNLSQIEYYKNLPLHYPYFGIYAAICGLFFLHRFYFDFEKYKPTFILLFLFFAWLVFISSSRNAQIYFFTSCSIITLVFIGRLKIILLLIPIIILLSAIAFYSLPRFAQFADALGVKELSWLCSIEPLNTTSKWLFGVGTGGAQFELQECYYHHKSWFYDFRYNSHNQYLTVLLTNGVFSFISFCLLIGYHIWFSISKKNTLLFLISFSLAISSVSESVLLVNKGIIFYTFWICIFARTELAKNEEV